jgi:hypothetical protein
VIRNSKGGRNYVRAGGRSLLINATRKGEKWIKEVVDLTTGSRSEHLKPEVHRKIFEVLKECQKALEIAREEGQKSWNPPKR